MRKIYVVLSGLIISLVSGGLLLGSLSENSGFTFSAASKKTVSVAKSGGDHGEETIDNSDLIDDEVMGPNLNSEMKSQEGDEALTTIAPDHNKTRVSKIHTMVGTAIQRDQKRLQVLESKRKRLSQILRKMGDESERLGSRLEQLDRISGILDKTTNEPKENPVKRNVTSAKATVEPQSIKSKSFADNKMIGHVTRYNSLFKGEPVAYFDDLGKLGKLKVRGDSLLIIDSKRLRVSGDSARRFVKMVRSIEKQKGKFQDIRIVMSEGTPEKQVEVLTNYLARQFGWAPKVRTSSVKKGAHFDLIMSSRKAGSGYETSL